MIINNRDPSKPRAGQGPRTLAITGGKGARPTFEGAALDWHLCPAYTSVNRLRIVSLLCAYPSLRIPEMSVILAIKANCIRVALWGMRDFHLVEGCPTRLHPYKSGSGKLAWDWSITEDGRKWFWRFARMTARYGTMAWNRPGFHGDTQIPPWQALRLHGHDSLCRPAGLATAHFMADRGPICLNLARTQLGFAAASTYILKWRKMGWLVPAPPRQPGYNRPVHYKEQRLLFTMEAHQAIGRHIDALAHAAYWCGYEADTWVEDYLKDLHPDWFQPCSLHD